MKKMIKISVDRMRDILKSHNIKIGKSVYSQLIGERKITIPTPRVWEIERILNEGKSVAVYMHKSAMGLNLKIKPMLRKPRLGLKYKTKPKKLKKIFRKPSKKSLPKQDLVAAGENHAA